MIQLDLNEHQLIRRCRQMGKTQLFLDELYDLMYVDLLDSFVMDGTVDPQWANLAKACHTLAMLDYPWKIPETDEEIAAKAILMFRNRKPAQTLM